MKKLQLQHYPQIPCKPFSIEVDSLEEAAKLAQILAAYDQFQFQQNIKPDFCSSTDLVEFDDQENDYISWEDEEGLNFSECESEYTDNEYWPMLVKLNDIKF